MQDIDGIIVILDCAAQLGAKVTIEANDVPKLLEALEPVIKQRVNYWQDLHKRVMLYKEKIEATQ